MKKPNSKNSVLTEITSAELNNAKGGNFDFGELRQFALASQPAPVIPPPKAVFVAAKYSFNG
jgi:hypothetical protein